MRSRPDRNMAELSRSVNELPRGLVAVAVTPFDATGAIDHAAFRSNLTYLQSVGAAGALVAGSIGEQPHLTGQEIAQLAESARTALGDSFPIIVGTGLEGSLATQQLSLEVAERGASMVMIRAPGYYTSDYSPEALRRHFEAVADRCPVPVLLYNGPEFVRTVIPIEVIAKLAEHPNVAGIKECSGRDEYLAALVGNASVGPLRVAIGFDPLLPIALRLGVRCAMMTLANVVPDVYIRLLTLYGQGRIDAFDRLFRRLEPLIAAIFQRSEVAAIKAAMSLAGRSGGLPRAPLGDIGPVQRQEICLALEHLVVVPGALQSEADLEGERAP